MLTKKFIPCIYLYHGNCVKSLKDTTIVETNPVRVANYYNENNADEIIIFDMSQTDEEHEEALDIIKEICALSEVDVIGTGNIKRMEDVKKLLYAGCKKAILDYSKACNIEITEEVSLKFGKDKIYASYDEMSPLEENKELIEKYISGLVLLNTHIIRETFELFSLPLIVQISQLALNKLFDIFSYSNLYAVTGNIINDNMKQIPALKSLCEEKGIPVNTLKAKYVWADFKKNNGYLKSTQMTAKYNMYRQTYCGCILSYNEMLERKNDTNC